MVLNSKRLLPVLLLVLVALSIGCGGHATKSGGSNTGGSAGPGGTQSGDKTMTPEAIAAVLDAADASFSDIVNATTDQTERSTRMAAWLKTRPEFAASGIVSPGNVWGRLLNGHLYVATTADIPGEAKSEAMALPGPSSTVRPPGATAPAGSRAVSARGESKLTLPASNQARVLNSLDPVFFDTPNDSIADMLRDHGYEVTQQRATLDRLKSISGDGVFLWTTHGGIGYDDRGKANFWSAFTDDDATGTAIIANKVDLDQGRLIYGSVVANKDAEGRILMRTCFGITKGFLSFYKWSFAHRAFLFLNACYSGASGMTADMVACTDDGKLGAAFGWTGPVSRLTATPASRYAFDRLLGVNQVPPAESVPQRPFDALAILFETGHAGLALEQTAEGQTLLTIDDYKHPDQPSLAPSLQRMEIAERVQESPLKGKSKLTLYGIFGDDQGQVQVDGVEVPVTSWATDKIECTPADLPGPGFSGDVIVISKERKSNAVPLTQWNGTLTYDIDVLPAIAGGVHSQLVMDVTFRGDVHRYREEAGSDPIDPKPFDFRAAQGSTAVWTLTGSPPEGTTWSGPLTASLPFGLNGTVNLPYGTGYIVSGNLDAKAGKSAFSFSYLGLGAQYVTEGGVHGNLPTIRDPLLAAIATGVGSDGYPKYSNNLALGYSAEDGLIPGQAFTGSTPLLNPKLTISDFVATHAPDRSKGENDKD